MKGDKILNVRQHNFNEVLLLIEEAIVEMEDHKIYQWDELYPDHQTILTDIWEKTMYGVTRNAELTGIVVLNQTQPHEYSNIKWELEDNNALVIHRLCVRPKFQRQGIAKRLLNFSEQFAIKNGHKSIRLDAFRDNHFALKLYDDHGYKKKGIVTFRKGDFYCYEKILP